MVHYSTFDTSSLMVPHNGLSVVTSPSAAIFFTLAKIPHSCHLQIALNPIILLLLTLICTLTYRTSVSYPAVWHRSALITIPQFICAAANLDSSGFAHSWPNLQNIVDRVHTHVCGHASLTDLKLLLQLNNIWNDSVADYLSTVLEKCPHCHAASLPLPARKVSLSSLSRTFNDVVCVDHLFLDDNRVFHIMDATTRYSAGSCVSTANMSDAIILFESS